MARVDASTIMDRFDQYFTKDLMIRVDMVDLSLFARDPVLTAYYFQRLNELGKSMRVDVDSYQNIQSVIPDLVLDLMSIPSVSKVGTDVCRMIAEYGIDYQCKITPDESYQGLYVYRLREGIHIEFNRKLNRTRCCFYNHDRRQYMIDFVNNKIVYFESDQSNHCVTIKINQNDESEFTYIVRGANPYQSIYKSRQYKCYYACLHRLRYQSEPDLINMPTMTLLQKSSFRDGKEMLSLIMPSKNCNGLLKTFDSLNHSRIDFDKNGQIVRATATRKGVTITDFGYDEKTNCYSGFVTDIYDDGHPIIFTITKEKMTIEYRKSKHIILKNSYTDEDGFKTKGESPLNEKFRSAIQNMTAGHHISEHPIDFGGLLR